MQTATKDQNRQLQRNELKWGRALMDAGYTVIPNVIVQRQKALGLDPIDLNIVLQLAAYWWHPGEHPFPSKRTLADAMQVHPSTIRRRIARMEKDGLIEREKRYHRDYGQQPNRYRRTFSTVSYAGT